MMTSDAQSTQLVPAARPSLNSGSQLHQEIPLPRQSQQNPSISSSSSGTATTTNPIATTTTTTTSTSTSTRTTTTTTTTTTCITASSSTQTRPRAASSSSETHGRKPRTPRDVAKKLFEQAISSSSSRRRSVCLPVSPDNPVIPPPSTPRVFGGGISGIPSHNVAPPPPTETMQQASNSATPIGAVSNCRPPVRRRSSTIDSPVGLSAPFPMYEKPQASTSGGAVTMTIQMAEPILFLQGLDGSENARRAAMLRGSMVLRVTKPTKIKAVTLTFRGRARTEWPEGIPPKKSEYCEEKEIMQHTWPFFNAQFLTAEIGHCADSFIPRKTPSTGSSESVTTIGSAFSHLTRTSPSERKNGLQITQSRSFSKGEALRQMAISQKGYRVFQPGDYAYGFELPLDSCLPETVYVDLGSVKYELEGIIERPGAFRPNLTGKKEVVLVRVPSDTNLEQTEPIAISRTWEDQLHYDIVISGKAFPLGSSIPIAFKLTPLAKVRCHRIKIFITENIEYSCKNRKVHRLDPVKKVQLFEKRAEAPASSTFAGSSVRVISGGGVIPSNGDDNDFVNGSDNLLGDLTGAPNVGPTELEFNVQLPGCNAKERDRIHCDTTYGNIQVHHWIKIVMRLSKQDPVDPNKRRHFEISIDSPFQILSCLATNANTTLPAYGALPLGSPTTNGTCMCPSYKREPHKGPLPQRAPNTTLSTINGIPRPMHLIRHPSTNPPPFNADIPPPPLITPPPRYETVIGGAEGLADYFARLSAATEDDDTDEDDSPGQTGGRPLLPLTPGGRVARSLDERRTWPVMQA